MADLKPVNPVKVEEVIRDIDIVKYHPSSIGNIMLNMLSDMTDGITEVLDPNNPFAYLLETNALLTAFNTQENLMLSKPLYPSLANNELDLYKHMSDWDYLNRFATPAKGKVTFSILYQDFINNAVIDQNTKDKIYTIPRYTKVFIDNYVFTIMAPLTIRMTKDKVIDIRYEPNKADELFPLNTNYIDYDMYTVSETEHYINFELDLSEVMLNQVEIAVEKSKVIDDHMTIPSNRLFYYLRAFYTTGDGKWKELLTTHIEDVYDINTPTCVVKVDRVNNKVYYYIPSVYNSRNMIGDKLKFVMYTTRGDINVNFSEMNVEDFSIEYSDIFSDMDLGIGSEVRNKIRTFGYLRNKIIDGKPEKSFAKLKYDVINNNLRPNLPITKNQIFDMLSNEELTPIRNHDVVTSREFLVKTRVPSNITRYNISRMSLDLIEVKTSMKNLATDKNSVVKIDDDFIVIPQDTVFKIDAFGIPNVLTKKEYNTLKSLSGQPLAEYVNNNSFVSTFYHYVLDDTETVTRLRAYEFNYPTVENINFKDYNPTTRLGANTRLSKVSKTDRGFELSFIAAIKPFDHQFSISNITPYLMYVGPTGVRYFLEGKLYLDNKDTPVFKFYIDTYGAISNDDRLTVYGFKDTNGYETTIDIDLTETMSVLYTTDSIPANFEATDMDDIINGSYIAGYHYAVSLEEHKIKFAQRLKHLYTRVHTTIGVGRYKRHDKVVYKRYDRNYYHPETNEITHKVNEIVLDDEGNPIIAFNIGDVMFDDKGDPIPEGKAELDKFLNLLLVDYKVTISNGILTQEYKDHVRLTLNSLITNNLERISNELLERTQAFLTVPNGMTDIPISYDGKRGYVKSNQAFKFEVYVNKRIYRDNRAKASIENTIKETLDEYLTGNVSLSKTILIKLIHDRISEFAEGVKIVKFTELDGEVMQIDNDNAEISIRKKLTVTPDGYDVVDDVSFVFHNTDPELQVQNTRSLSSR